MTLRDCLDSEVRRGPYLNIKTGEPVRVYNLEGNLHYADPYQTFGENERPLSLTEEVAKNLLRLANSSKIQKLLFDTKYSDDSRAPKLDTLPKKDLVFRAAQSQHKCTAAIIPVDAPEIIRRGFRVPHV
jgi:hypothetical protein